MSESIEISVFEAVGSSVCVASDDGENVLRRIENAIRNGRNVSLSFLNVDVLTSAFLNSAIGALYGQFSEQEIRERLSVKDMEQDDLALLKRVVENAKSYFKDPERFVRAERTALERADEI